MRILACVTATTSLSAQIRFPDFNRSGMVMVGSTVTYDGVLRLTYPKQDLAAAAWYEKKVDVAGGFITRFTAQVREPAGKLDTLYASGGDGFTFTIQNRALYALGKIGEGIGYSGITNSLTIEFDLYCNRQNTVDDPNSNHIAVQVGGSSSHRKSLAIGPLPDLSDGRPHSIVIEYLPGTLHVYVDACVGPILTVPVDLSSVMALDEGRAWVGFTSATGYAYEYHDILSWTFNSLSRTAATACLVDSAALDPGGTFASYRWSTGETTPSITVGAAGVYTLTAVDTTGCRPLNVIRRWTVLDNPKPLLAVPTVVTLCRGERILAVEPIYRGYYWSDGSLDPFTVARDTGKYWVVVVHPNGCIRASDTIHVTMAPERTLRIVTEGPLGFCEGEKLTLEASPGFHDYQWSNGEWGESIDVDQPGQYSVQAYDSNGCPAVSQPVVVRRLQRPVVSIVRQGPDAICVGDSVLLDGGEFFERHRWSTGDTTRTIVAREPGRYIVTATNIAGCSASDTITIKSRLVSTPVIIADGPTSFCEGGSVRLRLDSGFARYRWSTGDTTREIVVDRTGRFTATVTDSNGCSGVAAPLDVTVIPPPVITITPDGPPSFCMGDSVLLSASPGFARYHWSTGETGSEIVVRSTALYTVVAHDSSGCEARDSIRVIVTTPPVVDAGADTMICPGDVAPLRARGGVRYRWSPARGLSCADCADPVAAPDSTTAYVVTAFSSEGCSASDTVKVEIDRSVRLVHAHIGREHHGVPGREMEIPIVLDDPFDPAAVSMIEITLRYPPDNLRIERSRLDGTILADWLLDILENDRAEGLLRLRLTAPPNGRAAGAGTLVRLDVVPFIGSSDTSVLGLDIALDRRPCMAVITSAGLFRLDSICGLRFRMIEAFATRYALDRSVPNPFNPTTGISFSLGLDGPSSLTVHDASGAIVERLVDAHLDAGRYTVQWDASAHASGLYYYRLVSGEWSRTGTMLLVK